MNRRVLRRKAVEAKTGHSTSTIYEKMAAGELPRPIRLGVRAVGWLEDEIDAYIDQRVALRQRENSQSLHVRTRKAVATEVSK